MRNSKVLVINHIARHSGRIKAMINALARDESNQICLLALNGTDRELKERNMSYKTTVNYISREEHGWLEEETLSFSKSLGKREFDGVSLVKLLEYEHTSLWWFNEGVFWRHVVREMIHCVEILMRVIAQEKPGRIIIIKDNSLLTKAIMAVGQARGIPVQTLPPRLSLRRTMVMKSLWVRSQPQIIPHLKVVRDFLRKNVERIFGPSSRQQKDRVKILLTATMKRADKVVDPESGQRRKESTYLEPIIQKLREDNAGQVFFLYTFTSPLAVKVPHDVRWNQVIVRPWEYYLTKELSQTISEHTSMLKKRWNYLASNPSFRELCLYKGISLWDVLKDELRIRFHQYFPVFIRDIEISKEVMRREGINMVVIADEGSLSNKGILVAAHSKKIPTLAMQDGIKVSSNIFVEYGCSAEELKGEPSKNPLLPDKMCVFGDGSKDIFKVGGYPLYDSVVITGQPRYDILARASEIFDRERFCRSFNIELSKRMVLIASQPFKMFGNREIFIRSIFQALKDGTEIEIVIKPHPSEKEGWHKRLAEEMGVEVVVLPRNSNTNEALYACDVLITFYSTVALEAMILGKPVITINLTNQPDPVPYAKSGAAIGVYRSEDIAVAVKKALNDPETTRSLELGRKKYLYDQFYKLDGQATKRVVDLIYEMVKERTSSK